MIYGAIQGLLNYSVKNNLITESDLIVARNSILDALNLSDWDENAIASYEGDSIEAILAVGPQAIADRGREQK